MTSAPHQRFDAPYSPDDGPLVRRFIDETRLDPDTEARIDRRALGYIDKIRATAGTVGGLEDFLREFGLSTREGLALMVLAEALLRVPDADTQDRLIEDKLSGGRWEDHIGEGETWFVAASVWALGMSSRIVQPGETPDGIIAGIVKRLGQPAVRTATRQAMVVLGHHFVLGETIEDALSRAKPLEARGFRYSYDMLGEGARTMADAKRYRDAYAGAIEAIARESGGATLPDSPGISIKLSALHPRFEAVKHERVMKELVPALRELVRAAMKHDLNLTIDAEEADRLEITLDVFAAIYGDPMVRGWEGFGLAVQSYQKRAPDVVDWLEGLASSRKRRIMVRLVKGAYWDTEIKRAQERGLSDYPVFTRKAATDVSYLACAHRLLAARDAIFPQFASHNALTVATILEMAGNADGFEFQRLHGMGESLYDAVTDGDESVACRIYAPVGGHRDLLAYLVRRLLENGANTSFVARVGDRDLPAAILLKRPANALDDGHRPRHGRIVLPADLYQPARRNSAGLELGHRRDLDRLIAGIGAASGEPVAAHPIVAGADLEGSPRPVVTPIDERSEIGSVVEAPVESIDQVMAAAVAGFAEWSREPAESRAAVLDRLADLLEGKRFELVGLLAGEGGKTLVDGVAEVREAVDFCRYYAAQARLLFDEKIMPGPTGERDLLLRRGRGVFVCISPWNFPLAIFLGQITAALVAGNAVVAKPAEQTPLIAFRAFELLHHAGAPVTAAQLLPGDGGLGAALVAHPLVAGVAFTGSTETAWAINRTLAGKEGPIIPFIAETGGINAMIVDATALPEQVSDDVMISAFRSAGQRCSALRLLCLQDDVADPILAMLEGAAAELKLGDPRDPATDIGPVIDGEAKANLEAHVAVMRVCAEIRYDGDAPAAGTFVAPHIIEIADPSELTKEVFGPILHVTRWHADDLDALIDKIAATGYGLTLGIHSRIDETAERVVDRLAVGNVYVNRNMIGAVVGTQPFGGSGLSGTGPKAGGPDYLRRFSLEQVVATNTAAAGGNASLIAMDDE